MRTAVTWAFLASLAIAPRGSADPYFEVHWDDCNSHEFNQEFAGPSTYRQVILAGGLDASLRSLTFMIRVTTTNIYNLPTLSTPNAWRFDSPAGCQAGRLAVSIEPVDCPVLPDPEPSFTVTPEVVGKDLVITFTRTFAEGVDADPETRYTLFVLDFDHTRSAAGQQDPATACGNVDQLVCFQAMNGTWTNVVSTRPLWASNLAGGISWQDHGWCFVTAVEPIQWSKVKALYR